MNIAIPEGLKYINPIKKLGTSYKEVKFKKLKLGIFLPQLAFKKQIPYRKLIILPFFSRLEKGATVDVPSVKDPILESDVPVKNNGDGKYLMVVDDNAGDRVLLKMALEENKIQERFRFVANGLELIELLEQCKPTRLYPGRPLPSLILLDLYMPRINGHEALKVLKTDKDLRKIPIVVLTSSHTPMDVTQCYHEGANSFLQKPMEYPNLVLLMGLVKKYWLEVSHLPV